MRSAGHVRRGLGALCVVAGIVFGQVATAQQATGFPPPTILTLDQERLYSESLYGLRVQAELEKISNELADHNREVTQQLTIEEQSLTARRKTLAPEAFRPLADAFDEKVTALRNEQDVRIRDLQRRRDLERSEFTSRALPVLSALVREAGAVAILDERAVILSADHIDITDRAIAQIDTLLGDGSDMAPVVDSDGDGNVPPIGTDEALDPGFGEVE